LRLEEFILADVPVGGIGVVVSDDLIRIIRRGNAEKEKRKVSVRLADPG
jgi:hypothetical protein